MTGSCPFFIYGVVAKLAKRTGLKNPYPSGKHCGFKSHQRYLRKSKAPNLWGDGSSFKTYRKNIMLGTILVVILILMLLGAFTPGITGNWGYGPSGGVGLILIILVILLLLGRI